MNHSPLESPISPSHESRYDLPRLLDLAVLCQKYQAHKLLKHIMTIIEPLADSNLEIFLSDQFTLYHVLETAGILSQSTLAMTARTMLLDSLWNSRLDAYDALLFGERHCDKVIIGVAYYQILVSLYLPYEINDRLSDTHRQNLDTSRHSFAEQWQNITNSWTILPSKPGALQEDWIRVVLREIAKRNLRYYDVVGKLKVAIEMIDQRSGTESVFGGGIGTIESDLRIVKATLYSMFVPSEELYVYEMSEE